MSDHWQEQAELWQEEFGKMVKIRDRFVAELDAARAVNAPLHLAIAELREVLEHMLAMTQQGWITPEDKPTDWQLGWEAACEQFKIAHVNKLAEAALRKAKGE